MKRLLFVLLLLGSILSGCRWVNDADDTVFKEYKPSALLKKYEWFKEASAQLDKKQADILVWTAKVDGLYAAYEGMSRSKWPKDERERISIWESELLGIKASYNSLAAQYNAQMSKFNYRFCNVGDLPEGATVALPREYKPYETK